MHARSRRVAFLLPLAALLAAPAALAAQDTDSEEWLDRCRRNHHGDRRETHCEVRETRLGARETVRVDGRENGGAVIRAWDGRDVLVRARIQSSAPTVAEARRMAQEIRVSTGEEIHATGPETGRRSHWSVSYEIFVPRRTNLEVEAVNGSIAVRNVTGRMSLRTHNGPLSLDGVGGDVRGRTDNGPLSVTLAGSRWEGGELDVETSNGPVNLSIPEGYSASLTTGTVNGPMNIDIPVTVQGRFPRRFTTELGRGGAPVRVVTTNGPVNVRRR